MLKIIEELKRSDPKRREQLIRRMHEKNMAYFERVNPDLAAFVKGHGTGFYQIKITQTSVDIIDTRTGQYQHPPGELFRYMSDLGTWHHTAWVDKISMRHIYPIGDHGRLAQLFYERLTKVFPEFGPLSAAGKVSLIKIDAAKSYSGPVIFLGIFTGLHIASYLNRTEVRDLYLYEPDLDRFTLSCWFLDYEYLEKRFGRLMLHVGETPPESPLDELISHSRITAGVWVRLLPAYPSGQFDDITSKLALRWRALTEIFVPYDREQQNLVNGAENIRNKRPLFKAPPQLSSDSAIAVVGSGPSLANDMAWLKRNQDHLIIMCPISAARVLQDNGIRIDFQCTLDTEIDEVLWEPLRLDRKVPLVAYYKINPNLLERFDQVYLVSESNKANTVHFRDEAQLSHTHPTTGNLTFAFAATCKPARLFILGMDFGFKEAAKSHVEGSYLDDEAGGYTHETEVGRAEHILVEANFEESKGQVLTTSYYNSARFGVEAAIARLPESCQVINFSDGARISGAKPTRSSELEWVPDASRDGDLQQIFASFSADYVDTFTPYPTRGRILLDHFKETLLDAVTLKKDEFLLAEWAHRLDWAWPAVVSACLKDYPGDLRIEIFSKLIHDLLGAWYRVMLFTEQPDERKALYDAGLSALGEIFGGEIDWPSVLDLLPGEDEQPTTV